MVAIWTASIILAFAFAPTGAQSPQRLAPDSAGRALADYLRRAEAQGVSGVFLVAARDDVIANQAIGWRDPGHQAPNDTSTLFYIASIAKQFVAAGVLKLEDEGRLKTADSLGRFFPEAQPDKRSITIDQLLSHTSGLGRYGWDGPRRDWAIEDRAAGVKGILSTRLEHQPGATFDYQNTNYLLLAEIIERVTGAPFDEYLDAHLLRPARLRETYMGSRVTDALRPRVAWSLGDEGESFSILDRKASWLWHGRGVLMTAGDLYRWIRALDRGSVLSAAARRKLFRIRATLGTRYGYGAGWFVRSDSAGAPRSVFHGGDFGSYHSEVRLYPVSGTVLVAMTNVSNRGSSMTETILNHLLDVWRGEPNPLPAVASTSAATAPSIAGEYHVAKGDGLLVRASGSSLILTPVGQRATDWITNGDTTGWHERFAAGQRSLAFVDALNRRSLVGTPGIAPLPDDTRKDVEAEWAGLARVGGALKSYQLLGTVPRADGARAVSIVRLKFARDSLLFGVAWSGDTLRYTNAGTRNLVAPLVFAQTSPQGWSSFDWAAGSVRRVMVRTGPPNGRATLTLETTNGPVVFTR